MQAWERLRLTSDYCEGIEVPEEARSSFGLSFWKTIQDGIEGLWHEGGDSKCKYTPDDLAVTLGQRYAQLQTFFNSASCDSPIEQRLAGSLMWLAVDPAGYAKADYFNDPAEHFKMFTEFHNSEVLITSQYKIGKYRADFLVWIAKGTQFRGVVVECDGHDFHEKTKDQAARDKSRDRAIVEAGFPVLRFTGSEIWRDPHGCAMQVQKVMQDIAVRFANEIRSGGNN